MTHIPKWVIISAGTRLTYIIVLLRVGFHSYLSMASATFEVKSVDLNSKIILVETSLLSHVKFSAFVEEISASLAANTHWEHHSHIILFITWSHDLLKLRVIEVRRIVLV